MRPGTRLPIRASARAVARESWCTCPTPGCSQGPRSTPGWPGCRVSPIRSPRRIPPAGADPGVYRARYVRRRCAALHGAALPGTGQPGFRVAGGISEYKLIKQLAQALGLMPDIISLSAGTTSRKDLPLLSFELFWRRYQHYKGLIMVAAAGNNGTRRPFWPAAFPQVLSVGALAANWRAGPISVTTAPGWTRTRPGRTWSTRSRWDVSVRRATAHRRAPGLSRHGPGAARHSPRPWWPACSPPGCHAPARMAARRRPACSRPPGRRPSRA